MSTDNDNWFNSVESDGNVNREENKTYNRSENRFNRNRNSNSNSRPRFSRPGQSSRFKKVDYSERRNHDEGNRFQHDGGNNSGEVDGNRFYENQSAGNRYQRSNNDSNRQYRPYKSSQAQPDGNSYQQRPSYQRDRTHTDGYNNQERSFRPRPQGNDGYNSQERPFRPRPQGNEGYNSQERPFRPRPQGNEGYMQRSKPKAKYSRKKQIEYKEILTDPNEPIRLNKFLANSGVCSRREADEFITAGVVSVNGVIVTELGTKVKRSDVVKFHDQLVNPERKIYIILNKPKDCVTTIEDPQNRKTVMEYVKDACKERIYPVGRLDRNTTGVLLFTNDGELASKLTHPKFLKKKIYHVFCDKNVTRADLDQLVSGIQLEDGEIHADEVNYASDIDKSQVGIEIHSGKNRIVRRMFEALGYRVIKLDRVQFAGLTKKKLRRGDWRFLTEKEVNMLRMGAFE